MISEYNKTDVYENEILPLMQKIKQICAVEEIPFFATFALKNNNSNTTYMRQAIGTGSLGIELTDNQITRHICVANGFKTVPSKYYNPDAEIEDYIEDLEDDE